MGLLLLMVAIYTSMSPVEGLSTEETTTLATLFQCFPQLGALPEDPATRSTFRYGTRWTNATVCESDGWAFYGIYCEGGAIVGVRMCVLNNLDAPCFFKTCVVLTYLFCS